MKKLLFISLMATTISVHATENMLIPMKNGKPIKALEIVPLAKMNIPQEFKDELIANLKEEDEKGFIEQKNDSYVKYLLNVKKVAPHEIFSNKNSKNIYDTHLKQNISDIKLAFPFKTDWIDKKDLIGYAAIGSYHNGWTGIKAIFTRNDIGICSYSFNNLALSGGAAQLNTETTKYIVNKKPSSNVIFGDYSTGFIYNVTWFGNGTLNELECANVKFDKSILTKVIELANMIDTEGDK